MDNRLTKHFPLLLIALVLLSPAIHAQKVSEDDLDRICVDFYNKGFPGLAVSVGYKGDLLFSSGYGFADLEQKVAVDPSRTKFRVGSVAKAFTSGAIGKLVEEGKLDLDAPIQDYVPSFPAKQYRITTRQVAGHLAGIRHYNGNEMMSSHHYGDVLEGLDIFKDSPLMYKPGERFSYSSYAWNLASAVVEGAAGVEFLTYMDQVVFDPIGMDNTVADHYDSLIDFRGRYYHLLDDGSAINEPFVDNSYKWAGGGFLSTSEDLVKFGFANMYATYLNPETVEILQTSQKLNSGEDSGYGIGWFVRKDPVLMIGHGGGSIGGITTFATFPEQEIVIAVIANVSNGNVQELAEQLRDYLLEHLD